jgi:NDP-sugar pyrophosphorylase family protein
MINYTHQLSYGILETDSRGNITDVKEKPKYYYKASAGIYLVNKRCIGLVFPGFYTMPELISDARKKGLVVKGWLIKGKWMAIEHIKNLEEASDTRKKDWISGL